MSGKTVSAIMLSLLVISTLVLAFEIQPVKAQPTTIIVPDDYPTIQAAINAANPGDIVFVKDGIYQEDVGIVGKSNIQLVAQSFNTIHNGTIELEFSNNVLVKGFTQICEIGVYNCDSCSVIENKVSSQAYWTGIIIHGNSINTTVSQNTISNTWRALDLDNGYSGSCTVVGNIIRDNSEGLRISSSGNMLRNNTMENNILNFEFDTGLDDVSNYLNDIDSSNTVDGKPICCWINQHDKQIPSGAGCVCIINCTGITVKDANLTNSENGLLISHSSNCSVENVQAWNNTGGFYVEYSSGVGIANCTVFENIDGIAITDSNSSYLRNNSLYSNIEDKNWPEGPGPAFNLMVGGECLEDYIQDIDTSNTIDGKIVYYLVNQTNALISPISCPNAGYVALVNSTNVDLTGLGMNEDIEGVSLDYTSNSTVENTRVSNPTFGIYLYYSCGNSIIGNIVRNSNVTGVRLVNSDNNTIIGNTIANCVHSLTVGPVSSGNIIYHNNFINNTHQFYWAQPRANENCTLDNGYPSGGNYWSNYNGTDIYKGVYQNESGSDGIGDTPYVIITIWRNNTDNYPLMSPWTQIAGDLNGDGEVGLDDLVLLAQAYGSKLGDPNWNPLADMAPPYGIIGLTDLVTLAIHYGQHYP